MFVSGEPADHPLSSAKSVAEGPSALAAETQVMPAPRSQAGSPIEVILRGPIEIVKIVGKAIQKLFNPDSSLPGDQPLLLAVLTYIRREIQRTFFNRSPHAVEDVVTTSEGVPIRIDVLVNDTDRDRGDVLTITGFTEAENGVVELNPDGTFTYTPNAGYTGTDSFTYTISDSASGWHGHGLAVVAKDHYSTATVSVTVAKSIETENSAPTAGEPAFTVDSANTATGVITGTVHVTDAENDQLTYTLVSPAHTEFGEVTVDATDGSWTFTPTDTARLDAWTTPGADNIEITISVTDGTNPAVMVTVRAPVLPAAHFSATTISGGRSGRTYLHHHLSG